MTYLRIASLIVLHFLAVANGQPLPKIEATLSLRTEALFLGDPVMCKVEVANRSPVPVQVFNPQGNSRFGGAVGVFIKQGDGNDVFGPIAPGLFDGPFKVFSRAPPIPTTIIESAKTATFDLVLDRYGITIKERKWFFPVVGEYRLKLRLFAVEQPRAEARETDFSVAKQQFETNEIALRVLEPPTESDRKAFQAFRMLQSEWLPYAPAEIRPSERARQEFALFFKEYANSRYARFIEPVKIYLNFLIARSHGNLETTKECLDLIERKDLGDGWPPGWKSKLDIIRKQMRNVVYSETVGRKSGKP